MIFTQPSTAVKCGGAPQKIMWLAEEHVRQRGTRVCMPPRLGCLAAPLLVYCMCV